MVKEIILVNGDKALVDDEDYEEVAKYKWYVDKGIKRIGTLKENNYMNLAKLIATRKGLKLNEKLTFKDRNIYNNTRDNICIYNPINEHLATDTSSDHINPNLLCSIEIITIGEDSNENDLIEICILPLNGNYTPHQGVLPFNIYIKPNILGINDITNKILSSKLDKALEQGFEHEVSRDLFDQWFDKLNMKEICRIVPLTTDWLTKRDFIIKWLGYINFHRIFSTTYRDLIQATTFINDRCDFQHLRNPGTNKMEESRLILKDKEKIPIDLILKCVKIAEKYKKLISSLY